MIRLAVLTTGPFVLGMFSLSAWCAAPAPVHVRGTLRAVTAKALAVTTSTGTVQVRVVQPLTVRTLKPASAAQIRNGAFVGVTSVRQPNGAQRAVEVHIFPESMRGSGEGSRGWDLPGRQFGGSRMTNGTVSRPVASPSRMTNGTVHKGAGSSITVQYKGSAPGAQTIVIPPNVKLVSIVPGSPAVLKPGAHVFIMADRRPDGTLVTSRVTVGLNGLVPPM